MPVQAVDKRLNRGLVEVAQVGCGLSGLVAHHERLRVDQTESVDNDLALYGLDGIHDNGDGAGSELLERLLGVDIDAGKPAAETGMRMVPTNDSLWPANCVMLECLSKILRSLCSLPSRLPQHVHHLGLEDRIDSLNTDASTALRHSKDVDHPHGIVIHELSQHETHDFHRHTGAAVSQHLEESERGDVDGFGVIDEVRVLKKPAISLLGRVCSVRASRDHAAVAYKVPVRVPSIRIREGIHLAKAATREGMQWQQEADVPELGRHLSCPAPRRACGLGDPCCSDAVGGADLREEEGRVGGEGAVEQVWEGWQSDGRWSSGGG